MWSQCNVLSVEDFTTCSTGPLPIPSDGGSNIAGIDMLQRVWEEFSYRLDVVRTAGGHIEHL
jgi:hypothetical protein